jgi:hypothetical protein
MHDPAGDPTYEPEQPFGDPTPTPGQDPRPKNPEVNANGVVGHRLSGGTMPKAA